MAPRKYNALNWKVLIENDYNICAYPPWAVKIIKLNTMNVSMNCMRYTKNIVTHMIYKPNNPRKDYLKKFIHELNLLYENRGNAFTNSKGCECSELNYFIYNIDSRRSH